MQVIAFDFGLARIGIAVGQSITATASPLETIMAKDGKPNWRSIQNILETWKPDLLLVGEPFNMDDTDQQITKRARKFANQLHGRFGYKVDLMDERLSSAAARDEIFNYGGYKKLAKTNIDSIAAALILESWFMQL